MGYAGEAWYRTRFHVPVEAKEKPSMLTFGGIHSQRLWIWVNGLLIDHRERQDPRRPFDVDVSGRVWPGEVNSVAVLVHSSSQGRGLASGMHGRAFLWSPR